MTTSSRSLFSRLTLADGLLALAAIVGAVVYFWLMPTQHPDAAADLRLSEEQVIEKAEQFLAATGHPPDSLFARASFRRYDRLLDSLQQDLGRPGTVQMLQSDEAALLPAYYWYVQWFLEAQRRTRRTPMGYEVYLTQAGDVWGFKTRTGEEPIRPDRKALVQVLAPEDVETANVSLRALSDSTLEDALSFTQTDTLTRDPDGRRRSLLGLFQEDERPAIVLDSLDAIGLARYHLGDTPLGQSDLGFRVDSVRAATEDDPSMEVHLSAETPLHQQSIGASVTVLPTGTLKHLDVTFNPNPTDDSDTWEVVVPITLGSTYLLLILTFAVLFFRRLIGRTIDVKAALFDGLIVAVVMAVFIVVSGTFASFDPDDSIWEKILPFLVLLPVLGGLTALGVFLISGATDSIARPAWPEKLETMSLVRQVALVNQRVGAAMLRGTLLAYAVLGLMTVTLVLLPRARIKPDAYDFLLDESLSPLAFNLTIAGWAGYLALALALLGVGSVLYRRFKRGWVVVPGIALVITLFQAFPQFLEPGWFSWILASVFALAVALCFWRYDFLTTFILFFFTWVLWKAGGGWLVEGSPVVIDFVVSHGVAGGALLLGVTGLASNRTGEEQGPYVPPYVQEMTQQERLKSELDVARRVQESFLPRQMPNVAGLDIAAMCLAAYEVGGDYYDFIDIEPGKLAVVVGDVSGKGTQAAFYMTLTKGILQTLSREGFSPAEVMCRLNALFCANVPRGTFISMIYGVFDIEARTFTFARAGHNPVILKRSPSQDPDLVQPTGLAIGLTPGSAFEENIEERTLDLRIGDVLVFYTDGFSEAMNHGKDLYGDDRLANKISDLGKHSANEILHGVAEDVHHFVEGAGRHDDMTMVVVKFDRRVAYIPKVAGRERVVAEA